MQQIDTPDGLFHDGSPSTGELGTIVSADWLNSVARELENVVTGLGGSLDPARNDQISKLVLAAINKKADACLPLSGGDLQGDLGLRGTRERVTALGNVAGDVTIDTTAGGTFTATATGSVNWVFSGRPPAGQCRYLELRLVNGGAFTQTFPDGSVFSGGNRSLTVAGVDKLIVMLTATGADISIIRGMA